MSEYDDLMAAARRADKAGDAAAAKRLVQMAVASQSVATSPAKASPRNTDGTYGQPPEGYFLDPQTGAYTSREMMKRTVEPSRLDAATQGFGQGYSFQAMDELAGIVGGDADREFARAKMEANAEEYPWTHLAGQVAGAVSNPITRLFPGSAITWGNIGKGAAVGGVDAFAHGYGAGEGDAKSRMESGGDLVPYGVAGGAAAPFVAKGGEAAARAVAAPFKGLFSAVTGTPNKVKADRQLLSAMRQSGKTPDDIADDLARAGREGQPEYTFADALGVPGQRQVAGIARQPGDMRGPLIDMLEDRQLTQGDRITTFLEDALDPGKTSRQTDDALRAARRAAANKLYDEASATARPVNPDGAISLIDDAISGWQNTAKGQGMTPPEVTRKLIGLRRQLAGTTQAGEKTVLSDYDSVLGIYRQLDDDISTAYRNGKGNLGEALKSVRTELEKALADSSDQFRTANAKYRADSEVIDKIDIGRKDAGRARFEDTAESRAALKTPEQAAAYKSGYYDPMATKIQNSAVGADKSRDLFKPKTAADLRAMAKDPDLLSRQLGREKTMFETRSAAVGGSKTADNIADQADVSPEDISMVMNILSGRIGTAVTQGAARSGQVLSGGGQATRDFLAKKLMSSDGQAILDALKQAKTEAERRSLISLLFRSGNRAAAQDRQ